MRQRSLGIISKSAISVLGNEVLCIHQQDGILMQGEVRTSEEGGLREVHRILGLRQPWNEDILCRLFGILLQPESLVVLLLLYRQLRVLKC